MSDFFDEVEIDIPCENCGHETKKSIAWIKQNSHLICDCGTQINISKDQFIEGINEAESMINDLENSLKKLGQ